MWSKNFTSCYNIAGIPLLYYSMDVCCLILDMLTLVGMKRYFVPYQFLSEHFGGYFIIIWFKFCYEIKFVNHF